MTKDATLFTKLNNVEERKIYVADDFSLDFTLDIASHGDITFRHSKIVDVFHVPNLSSNMLYVS
jgi:hypothetical protein